MKSQDTIAAIATGTTNAGISIIRISGTDAISVADAVFVSKKGKKTCIFIYRFSFSYLTDSAILIKTSVSISIGSTERIYAYSLSCHVITLTPLS